MNEQELKLLMNAVGNSILAKALVESIFDTITDENQRSKILEKYKENTEKYVSETSSIFGLEFSEKLQAMTSLDNH